ncbi:dystonin-like [Tachypleus tridentatus]|uniref:dystonin-like n=1 Tax=Tachypleus tridentatus TaxID=6853 RepID=UPI003FD066D4
MGLFIKAETRTAVEEKYKFAGDSISKLLKKIDDIREQLAELGQLQEDIIELQNQIDTNKNIKKDLDYHQRAVLTCLDKVQQVIEQGAEVLNKDEMEQLQKDCTVLRKSYNKTSEESEKLLHRLTLSQEELQKFNMELLTFKKWLLEAEEKLKEQDKIVGDLKNLKENSERFKEFTNDVIAHQADLRFITMIAQRFIDESKEYLKTLNDIRTNLPRRRAHVEPKESEVKAQVSFVSTTYQNLLNQVNRLRDRITTVEDRQHHYSESLEKATNWLLEVQATSKKLLEEPVAGEPKLIQDQLDRIKRVSLDILGQSRFIENFKQAGKALLDTLEGTEASIVEKQSIENTVQKLEDDHCTISNDINEKRNDLQTILVQSQDIQDGLDRLLKWLNEAETTFRTQNKAISLTQERLDDQVQEHKIFQTDINSQRPSIDAITASAKDLSKGSNQRLAKKVETKVKDINTRFDKLSEKSQKRGILLEEVVTLLSRFEVMVLHFEEWIHEITETLESKEIVHLSPEEYCTLTEDTMNKRNAKKEDFDKMIKTGKSLVAKRDVTDTTPRKEKVKLLEQQWKELGDLLTEKQQEGKTRTQQLSAYETLRSKVLDWLNNIESRVEELEVVVIDKDTLQHQAAELKPIFKEHIDYAPTINKVNVLGNSYDIILHGERGDSPRRHTGSPTKKVISSTSPTKKFPAKTRHSPDTQSPTHGKSVSIQSPLSSISSGFSSQRSSADNLGGVEDLTPIQHQLSEINNRYNLLGVKLSDREQEIESLTEEVKCHLQTLKTLATFVKEKEEQSPKESFPENKEQAHNQLHILKTIHEEFQEKRPDLDKLKIQIQELLRKKSEVQGSDIFRNQLHKLVTHWAELVKTFKEQLDVLQWFKDFQETRDLLTSWLIQKEKMLQVLGPIASVPQMVTSQMQQVQIMIEEFKSQQPLLDRLVTSGEAVITTLSPSSPASITARNQTDAIHKLWKELMSQLSEREKSLNAACGITKEFHDGFMKLHDSIQLISDNCDQLFEDPVNVEEHLNKLTDWEEQLESQRPRLAAVESMCEHLCELLSDSTSKTEISNKLIMLQKQYTVLTKKIDNKKAELESSQKEDQDFILSIETIETWLNKMQDWLSKPFTISADHTTLMKQVKDREPIHKDILDKEHEIYILLSKGNAIVNEVKHRTGPIQLKEKLDTIKTQWDTVRKETTDRQNRLLRCTDTSPKLHSALTDFLPWLEQSEEKLARFHPVTFQKTELEKQTKDIQVFKNELSSHSHDFENICNFGEMLLDETDIDQEDIKQKLVDLKCRWNQVNQGVLERSHTVDNVSRLLTTFLDKTRNVQHTLQQLEEKLISLDGLTNIVILDRLKVLLEEATGLTQQFDLVRESVDQLTSNASLDSDASHIKQEVLTLESRHKQLIQTIEKKRTEVEFILKVLSDFTMKEKEVQQDMKSLEETLDNMTPAARVITVVETQIVEMKDFMGQLDKVKSCIEDVSKHGEDMIDQGYTTDVTSCREKTFHKNHIEPLSKHIADVNKQGQDLVQSAFPGVDTLKLEQDLETLTKKWNDLQERLNERERLLDLRLLQSGKFQEALEGVQKWLQDTEEMIANQKAPSADYKVVKAQLQEQKFLRKLLLDRQNSMTSLTEMGTEVMHSFEPAKRKEVETQLHMLTERFSSLLIVARKRMEALEQAIPVAQGFHDKIGSLMVWLECTEKRLVIMKIIPIDQDKIKELIIELKELHEDITNHKILFEETNLLVQTLVTLVNKEEAHEIQDKFQETMDRYNKITEDSTTVGELLAQTLEGVQNFWIKHETLLTWVQEVYIKLTRYQILSVYPDKIQEQIMELTELHSEITDYNCQVDDLITISQELMKHASGDDVIQLKDKVDIVQGKYNEVSKKCTERQNQALEVLPLAQNFQSSREKLVLWIDETEQILKTLETVSLSTQESTIEVKG